MTHDEIAQLDAAQLRLEVAMVKGYIDNRQFCENEFLGPDNEWYYLESEYSSDRILPNWPADIAAAWELGEEFPEWSAGKYPSGYRFIGWDYRDGELYKAAEEYGQSIEIAICRAYLMWKQG